MLKYIEVSAPGKVILLGEHAVVYKKKALACSLGKYTTCKIKVIQSSNEITIRESSQLACSQVFEKAVFDDLSGFCKDPTLPTSIIQEQFYKLQLKIKSYTDSKFHQILYEICMFLYLGIASGAIHNSNAGLIIEISSELPFGCGLGSSASLCVALACAFLLLCEVIELQKDCDEESQGHFSDKDLDLINSWALEGEKIAHGQPSGIDNCVITYGGAICFQKGSMRKLESTPPIEIILVNTRVPRNTKEIVLQLRERYKKLPRVYDALFDAMEAITTEFETQLEKLQFDTSTKHENRELFESLKELIALNHGMLRTLGVSHESIEAALKVLHSFGFKGKLTGAGCGGCLFALIAPDCDNDTVTSAVESIENAGYECWKAAIGCNGVRCILHER